MGVLDLLCKRASPNQYDIPLGSDAIWDILGAGRQSSAGVSVSREKILGYPAVWRGVNLLSRDVAKLPLFVYQRLEDGGKQRDRMHPAHRLLHQKSSPYMTAFTFRQTLQSHALIHGNGYAYIFRDANAGPTDMLVLDPEYVTPIKEDGRLLYLVTNMQLPDGQTRDRKILPENILHIRGLSHTGLVGYSVVDILRESLGLGLAAQKYGSVFFKNNARPSMVIEMPGQLRDTEAVSRLRDSWGKIHEGIDNSNKPAILENQASVKNLSFSNEDAQFLQTREFEIRQVANIIGVPPHKIGDPTRTSHSSLESENQAYLQDSLDPWLCNWEKECEDKLLTEQQKTQDTHIVEFQRDAIIRVDKKTETESLAVEVNNGLLSLDEARAIKNRPPLPDGLGSTFRKPMNHENIGAAHDSQNESEQERQERLDVSEVHDIANAELDAGPEDELHKETVLPDVTRQRILEAHRQLLVDCTRRMVRRLGVHAGKAARDSKTFSTWLLDEMDDQHRAVCIDAFAPAINACALVVNATGTITPDSCVDGLLVQLRGDLNELSGQVPATGLALAVKEQMASHALHLPERVADAIISRQVTYKETSDAT